MTVAETITEAIIGQVATAKKARRQGYASICVKSIISQCEGKTLYILPIDENAAGLYSKIGFVPCGSWFELEKTY
jgi:predicted GNAT family acetyltransferase